MANSRIVSCGIFPGIGIARVGDSPDGYFVGPEVPGLVSIPEGGYKDGEGRIKRQAARFRVYGYDDDGKVVGEITPKAANVTVKWTVTLANRKASGVRFSHVRHDLKPGEPPDDPSQFRNRHISDRGKLEVCPTPRMISGVSRGGGQYAFQDGEFFDDAVYLGELRTDSAGRLLVFGGRGVSRPTEGARPLTQYADNDGWHDDTSDGPITAAVTIDGRDIPVKGTSWVIVAPPKFAPFIRNVVSLYDVMSEAAGLAAPKTLSFTDHIYPHFAAFADQQWVNGMALRGHGPQKPGNFRDPKIIEKLNDNGPANADFRHRIFARLRAPASTDIKQASYNFMPALSGDEGDATIGQPTTWLSLTKTVHAVLERWAAGEFDSDWPGVPPEPVALELMALDEQPAALTRAALEPCAGGPFFPGIEISYISRFGSLYSEPFRFDAAKLKAGDITQRMAVPWQADFYECRVHWWPAQRPDDVLNEATFRRAVTDFPAEARTSLLAQVVTDRIRWDRGVGTRWTSPEADPPADDLPAAPGDNDMLAKWKSLGFVVPMKTPYGETSLCRSRAQLAIRRPRRSRLFLLPSQYRHLSDFIPKATRTCRGIPAERRSSCSTTPTPAALDDMYRYFEYSPDCAGAAARRDLRLLSDGVANADPLGRP